MLNGLISNNTFRGRGLTARFLYSMPKSAIGTRAFQATPIPEKAKQGYTSLVKSLLAEEASNEPIELSSGASEIQYWRHYSMKWKDVLEIWGKKEVTVVEIVSTTVTDLESDQMNDTKDAGGKAGVRFASVNR